MVQVFTIYGVIMSVIGMFVALTQVDFMFIRITADLIVNAHTTYYFLRGKEVNPELYNEWKVLSSETNKKHCRSHDTADGTEKCSSIIEFELEDAHTDNEKSSMLKVEL